MILVTETSDQTRQKGHTLSSCTNICVCVCVCVCVCNVPPVLGTKRLEAEERRPFGRYDGGRMRGSALGSLCQFFEWVLVAASGILRVGGSGGGRERH